MDLLAIVRSDYQEAIALTEMDPELRRALKAHERVPRFIDNLAGQFFAAEKTIGAIDRETIKLAVYDLTKLFITAVEQQAKERRASDLDKLAAKEQREREARLLELANAIADGGTNEIQVTEEGIIHRGEHFIDTAALETD